MIDMAQLISSQQPDSSGKLFPTGIREGSVVFESSQGFTAPMNLSINAATFNTELATCLQHCICCTGVSTTALTPNPCYMAVAESMQATATAYYNNRTNSNVTNSVSWLRDRRGSKVGPTGRNKTEREALRTKPISPLKSTSTQKQSRYP